MSPFTLDIKNCSDSLKHKSSFQSVGSLGKERFVVRNSSLMINWSYPIKIYDPVQT